jgi:hypothetical protein
MILYKLERLVILIHIKQMIQLIYLQLKSTKIMLCMTQQK